MLVAALLALTAILSLRVKRSNLGPWKLPNQWVLPPDLFHLFYQAEIR
jgi:hypothetical protein